MCNTYDKMMVQRKLLVNFLQILLHKRNHHQRRKQIHTQLEFVSRT